MNVERSEKQQVYYVTLWQEKRISKAEEKEPCMSGKLLYNAIEAKMKEWSTVSSLWGVKYNEHWELTTILSTTEVMGYLHKSGFCGMARDEVKLE